MDLIAKALLKSFAQSTPFRCPNNHPLYTIALESANSEYGSCSNCSNHFGDPNHSPCHCIECDYSLCFPCQEKEFLKLISDSQPDSHNDEEKEVSTQGEHKIILYYFGTSWCPGCKTTKPYLERFYNYINKNWQKDFKMFSVMTDHNENKQAWLDYHEESDMPKESRWPKLEFNSKEAIDIKRKFKVCLYPTLLIVNKSDGALLAEAIEDDIFPLMDDKELRGSDFKYSQHEPAWSELFEKWLGDAY